MIQLKTDRKDEWPRFGCGTLARPGMYISYRGSPPMRVTAIREDPEHRYTVSMVDGEGSQGWAPILDCKVIHPLFGFSCYVMTGVVLPNPEPRARVSLTPEIVEWLEYIGAINEDNSLNEEVLDKAGPYPGMTGTGNKERTMGEARRRGTFEERRAPCLKRQKEQQLARIKAQTEGGPGNG